MISSEVQRTLVKSPPELWAELSDPAALARHLGEFGEIRITRIDPEQAVEWEAEDASGKVQIKPSAWGTRVTLTVTRQMPQPDAPPASQPPAQSEETRAEPQPATPADVDAGTQTEADSAVGAQAEPAAHAEPETAAHARPQPPAPTEPDAAPPVQAEPEPAVHVEPEPAAQTEVAPWSVRLAKQPPDVAAATAMTVGAGTEAEVEPTAGPAVEPTAEPDPELLPRRGFFSRLFGRRRRPAASGLDRSDMSASAASPSEPPVAITALEPQPTAYGQTTATWESQFGPPETAAGAQWQPQPVEAAAGLDSQRPGRIETDAANQSQPAEPLATDATVEEPQLAPADAVGEQVDQPSASTDAEPQDISDQLEAAEEAAAEETAVALTAVLDRLGAAHHRPFSRG